MKNLILAACLVVLSFGCRKKTKVYSIEGRILQSSSNPVPQGNYKLTFYQKGSPGIPIPIAASSASSVAISNNDGYFNCKFQSGEGSFLLIPYSNSASLSMMGENNSPLINIHWSSIPAKDTVLGNVYLYKKINKAIIKIKSAVEILPTDTISIVAQTSSGDYKKTMSGLSIQARTITAVDTIPELISANFDVSDKQYRFDIDCESATNKRSNYSYTFTEALDEDQREFILFIE